VRAADIRRPVLLVHGTADEVAADDDVRALAAELTRRNAPHELLHLTPGRDGAGGRAGALPHGHQCREGRLTTSDGSIGGWANYARHARSSR
jgi:predicted alpha/beta-hydrolase family hydrolase